jgi:hypothetical protein
LIVRTWGAGVLRPYMTVMADGFAVKVRAEILRFAQDDNDFFWEDDIFDFAMTALFISIPYGLEVGLGMDWGDGAAGGGVGEAGFDGARDGGGDAAASRSA